MTRITHFGHAALLVENETDRILIDPGTLSSGFERLGGLRAVLITHQHADHVDAGRVGRVLDANPDARLVLDPGSTATYGHLVEPSRLVTALGGEGCTLGSTEVTFIGDMHAVIHPDVPLVPNIGYFFDAESLFVPGDALTVADHHVDVLALPISGPWQRLSDAVDYLRQVRPRVAVPIHEGMLAHPSVYLDYLRRLGPPETSIATLAPGVATEV